MASKRAQILSLIAMLAIGTPGLAQADLEADSLALIGAWKWAYSSGGFTAGDTVKRAPSKTRVISFRADGTYVQWEQDSVGLRVARSGTYTIHRHTIFQYADRDSGGPSFWLELTGWFPLWNRELVTFSNPDEIRMYPGGGDIHVDDASTVTYVRDKLWRAPPVKSGC